MQPNKTNIKALKELVLDEHKLVTYISLSKELCIHVNEAKSLLRELIQNLKKTQPDIDLSVSYVVSGLLSDNSGCLSVCSESELATLKKSLKIVFYEHVYCVSRGTKSIDRVALTAVNKFEDLPLCTGLIKANSCIKRTDNEIGNLMSRNHAALIVSKASSVQQKSKDKIKENKKHEEVKSVTESKLAPVVKTEILSPKKYLSNNHTKQTPNKGTNNKTVAKGIAGFFNKVNGDSTKTKKAEVKIHEAEAKKHDIKVEKDIKVEPTSSDANISPAVTNGLSKPVNTKGNNSKGLVQLKKNAKVDKKRKRLLHVSDSESDTEDNDPFNSNEMNVDNESEDEIPPTPTINTVKITSGIVNPKKRRKIVDKTYTDEDGYILTKKEEVYESFSENEEDVKVNSKLNKECMKQEKENGKPENDTLKKENTEQVKLVKTETSPKKTRNKKISPPKKGKQPTLNNFFKKI